MKIELRDIIAVIALISSGISIVLSARGTAFQRKAKVAELRRQILSSIQDARISALLLKSEIRSVASSIGPLRPDELFPLLVEGEKSGDEALASINELFEAFRNATDKEVIHHFGVHFSHIEDITRRTVKMRDDLHESAKKWLTRR